jgi:hypothetical protein
VPRPEHVVHRIGEALGALITIRIVCGVHTAEAKAVEAGPVFYGVVFVAITLISESRLYGVV